MFKTFLSNLFKRRVTDGFIACQANYTENFIVAFCFGQKDNLGGSIICISY
jgi:hypothetical protein